MWNRIGRVNSGGAPQSPLASRVPTIQVEGPPPEVVTAGLTANFDAATYSGTGDWTDSIGNQAFTPYDSTNTLRPSGIYYSAVGGGSFEFSKGFNCLTDAPIMPVSGETSVYYSTLEMWYYHIKDSVPSLYPDPNPDPAATVGWGIGIGANSNYFRALQKDATATEVTSCTYGPLDAGKWYQLVAVFSYFDPLKIYVNGVLVSTAGTVVNVEPGGFQGPVRVMGGNAGSLAIIRTYDRALSDSEVLQNYNATKSRFTDTPSTVITTGLINYFDAAPTGVSPTKYSGVGYDSSGVWRDQVGSADITLYNSPAYDSSTNGGLLTFTRTSSQYGASAAATMPTRSDMTVEIWAQTIPGYGAAPPANYIANILDGNNSPWIIRPPVTTGALNYVKAAAAYMIGGSTQSANTVTLTGNTWYQIVLRKSGGYNGYMYVSINGCSNSSMGVNYGYYWTTAGQLALMWNGATTYRGGKMAIVRIYNYRLSDAEVLQNYNATKARFGLA